MTHGSYDLKGFPWFAELIGRQAGSAWFFGTNCLLTLIWFATGFWLHWSESWNFAANTSTTVATWLMSILILHSTSRGVIALQLKLDELVRVHQAASNQLVGIERRNELDKLDRLSDWAGRNP